MSMLLWVSGCALWKLSSVGRSQADLAGEWRTDGVEAEVRILRDLHGVPHVRAGSERDAWFGLGFAHAQDRLFQADLTRRTASGRLASWFGAGAADVDAFGRALGLPELARARYAAAPPETRAMLEAYAAGMNAGAASLPALPIEYRLLDVAFEPWTPEDCFGVGFLFAWTLEDNLAFELAAIELRDQPPAVLDALLRIDPESPPVDPYWDELRQIDPGAWSDPFRAWIGLLGGGPDSAEASNNWVVGGERSASGKPIVASDPHLSQSVPSLWYAAEIKGGDLHVAGGTVPGMPGVLIGHDERVAWGLTNVMADQNDLVVLERAGERGYVLAGEAKELERTTIEVPVKGGSTAQRTVDLTAVGPVVNTGGDHLIALRWSALEVDDHLPEAVRALNRAGSVAEVLEAIEATPLMVAQNLVVADVDGDYAWQQVGGLVQRKAHTGRVPYPGSDPQHGWAGWLTEAPGEHHPERGWVRSANSRPDHPLSHAISTSYVPPLRLERIDERIAAVASHDPETQHQIQLDARELLAARYRDALLDGVTPESDRARQCHDLLASWDLEAGADSAGAAVWALFLDAYVRHAIEDDLGARGAEVARSVLGSGRNPLGNGLFESTFVEDRSRSVSYALERACADLAAGWGDDPAGWSWGAVHPLQLRHPFAERAPSLLKSWNMAPVPFPGSGSTVAAAAYGWGLPGERPVTGMASMRLVMPLDDLGASTLVYPGGQSGQPKSSLYASHYVHFVAGRTLPLWFDDEDVAANAVHTAVLRPAE